jgi:hypothetical protein
MNQGGSLGSGRQRDAAGVLSIIPLLFCLGKVIVTNTTIETRVAETNWVSALDFKWNAEFLIM